MSVINTNVSSLLTQNALAKNERSMAKTMEQLSTGKRINSAQDDAAGLAISSRMTSQIRGLGQAIRNANDAISMIQTYDGAMVEVTNMMQRMRELAVQSASDTNTSTDRDYLNLEFQQLVGEVQRIGGNTQWNGDNVMDGTIGTSGAVTYQVGANASQTVGFTFQSIGSTEATASASTTTDHVTDTTAQVVTISAGSGSTLRDGDVLTFTVNGKAKSLSIAVADSVATITDTTLTVSGISDISVADVGDNFGTGGVTLTAGGTASTDSFTIANVKIHRGISGSLGALDVDTQTTANSTITSIDTYIENVNNYRATAGAVMNRLEYASDNLSNVKTNAEASRSRVEDADYAAATTNLARTQIIAQAATAMLAQANQMPQSVLSLLK